MKQFVLIWLLAISVAGCKKDMLRQADASSNNDIRESGAGALQLVFSDSLHELTGVAVSATGRMFTNYPLWNRPHKYDVVEITSPTQSRPYPDARWNNWNNGVPGFLKWVCVQAVYIDDKDKLWIVDPASPFMKGVYQLSYKLVKIDLATNTVEKIYSFVNVADENSYINDVRVDTRLNYAYLSNSNEGGIIVIDLNSGTMRQVLQGNPSVISDPDYIFKIDGHILRQNGAPVKVNSDGIALTPDGSYLYYKPLSDDHLYRIKTAYLRNADLTAAKLGSKVEDVGRFTPCDGMIFDKQGNLYLSDMENYSIIKITPDLKMHVFIKSPLLIWPDSFSISGGYLYVSCSQLQKQEKYNTASSVWPPPTPFAIYRIKL